MKNRLRFAVLALILVVGAGVAFGQAIYNAVAPLPEAPIAVADPVDASDSGNYATPLRPRLTRGNKDIVIQPTFSHAGGAATFHVALYHRIGSTTTFAALVNVGAISATTSLTSNGTRFLPSTGIITVPTYGCQVYDVRVGGITNSGNVSWTSWGIGHNTNRASAASE